MESQSIPNMTEPGDIAVLNNVQKITANSKLIYRSNLELLSLTGH